MGHSLVTQFVATELTLRSYKDIFEVVLIVLVLTRAADSKRVDFETIVTLMLDRRGRTDVESRPGCYSK